MGGELSLLPFNGGGADFRVTVQFKPGKIEQGVVAKIADYQDNRLSVHGDLSILVVDDVKENRELLYEQLGHYGFSVRVAGDGQDAVEKVKESKPDMILMDYRMPVLNGIEATKIIKEIYGSEVKIAMVSASVYAHETEIFNGCGVDFILNKPVVFSELETMLGEVFPDKVKIEKSARKAIVNAASFDNVKNIPAHYLTEIEELADYLHSLSTTMKLNELSTTARKILDHG